MAYGGWIQREFHWQSSADFHTPPLRHFGSKQKVAWRPHAEEATWRVGWVWVCLRFWRQCHMFVDFGCKYLSRLLHHKLGLKGVNLLELFACSVGPKHVLIDRLCTFDLPSTKPRLKWPHLVMIEIKHSRWVSQNFSNRHRFSSRYGSQWVPELSRIWERHRCIMIIMYPADSRLLQAIHGHSLPFMASFQVGERQRSSRWLYLEMRLPVRSSGIFFRAVSEPRPYLSSPAFGWGKTSLVRRYMYDTFEEGTAPTVGARRALCAPTQLVLPFIFILIFIIHIHSWYSWSQAWTSRAKLLIWRMFRAEALIWHDFMPCRAPALSTSRCKGRSLRLQLWDTAGQERSRVKEILPLIQCFPALRGFLLFLQHFTSAEIDCRYK